MSFYSKVTGIFNILWLRLAGASFGKNVRIIGRIGLKINGQCSIGNNFRFLSGGMFNTMARNICGYIRVDKDATLKIGNNVGISSSCLWVTKSLVIGDNVKVGALCIIMDSDIHSLDAEERASFATDFANARKSPVVIRDNAFIGASSIICKGVTIGKNSVVGTGSVVTKDVPDNEIWAGNPARFVRKI